MIDKKTIAKNIPNAIKTVKVKGLGKKSYSLIVEELKKMGIEIDS